MKGVITTPLLAALLAYLLTHNAIVTGGAFLAVVLFAIYAMSRRTARR